ncbi:F0F1 ATP synthase subunit C [Helicobacter acinonychis]|uniref:ATP synthase subunit c n=1 Tax=Helicobacter acinonychis (strain Sheeba) TaxID=382638 RepID=ATPL_HELAH|nr:F0F1 ATP synthase subunit C [Helicobacter acinonychis]Q17VM5.1 RecName: Full=ATP synthase subunit c; AltName: Full=ATP synthase F(0) sector subunit c; AltName: Full=F-type ATPase subunit c; Short=F-ATPase subunit c; AltName: Full=Lipid-binding protein [Helicobacter acinonychis str. Sheeba]CAK00301.1 ATP synthase subunit c [Helicobacter acinonychis str. Sheeba]STP05146.1 F0F1 ATP synthase subunit C [Helicobacter acinonychis]
MKFLALFFLALVGVAFAYDGGMDGMDMIKSYSILGAMIGLGIAAFGGAIGMGNAAAATITGTARNPGVGGKLLTTMFVAMAMIEAQVIYTLVFAIIAIYSNPFLS